MNREEKIISLQVLHEVESYILQGVDNFEAIRRFDKFLSNLPDKRKSIGTKIINNAIALVEDVKVELVNSEIILDFLNAYRLSRIARRRKGIRRQISDASKGKLALDAKELNEISLTQNRARGKIYEQMGLVLVQYYLREIENIDSEVEIIYDKAEFECLGYLGVKTKRRFDLFLPEYKVGIEIKSGRIIYSTGIRNQISKDKYLLQRGIVKDVWWFLFYGGSSRALSELKKCYINYIDFTFNDYE